MGRPRGMAYRIDKEQLTVYGSNKISGMNTIIAKFMPYNGDGCRCAKCIFSIDGKCEELPCTSDERKDGKEGFFRAANVTAVDASTR